MTYLQKSKIAIKYNRNIYTGTRRRIDYGEGFFIEEETITKKKLKNRYDVTTNDYTAMMKIRTVSV